jgi:hypothetical protein
MIKVVAGKVRKTGFFQKAGFPGDSERILGICYKTAVALGPARPTSFDLKKGSVFRPEWASLGENFPDAYVQFDISIGVMLT